MALLFCVLAMTIVVLLLGVFVLSTMAAVLEHLMNEKPWLAAQPQPPPPAPEDRQVTVARLCEVIREEIDKLAAGVVQGAPGPNDRGQVLTLPVWLKTSCIADDLRGALDAAGGQIRVVISETPDAIADDLEAFQRPAVEGGFFTPGGQ